MLSSFYNQSEGYRNSFDYMKNFNFEQESNEFHLMFDLGDEESDIYPSWILTEADHDMFNELYLEFSTEELIELYTLLSSAVEKLKEYEKAKLNETIFT